MHGLYKAGKKNIVNINVKWFEPRRCLFYPQSHNSLQQHEVKNQSCSLNHSASSQVRLQAARRNNTQFDCSTSTDVKQQQPWWAPPKQRGRLAVGVKHAG